MPKWIPKLHDATWLRKAYVSATVREIARELGCVPAAVTQALHRHGIQTRPPGQPPAPEQLHDKQWLQNQYLKYTTHQIAAQLGCAQITVLRAMQDLDIPRKGHGRRPSEKTTYRMKTASDGQVRGVHRLVMEQYLGRKLETNEHVHHVDGNPGNNDLRNLVVLTKSDHHNLHGAVRYGKPNGRAKLTADHIRTMRNEYRKGNITQKELATRYGLDQGTVSRILRGSRYTWAL